ncbi:hypothetical protein G210_5111, partial [Candida maltosa Xu316]
ISHVINCKLNAANSIIRFLQKLFPYGILSTENAQPYFYTKRSRAN